VLLHVATAQQTPLRKFQYRRLFIAPLDTASKFLFITVRHCLQQYEEKEMSQLDLCAPLTIAFLIANNCTSWRRIFKGLSQDVGRADFSIKFPRLSLEVKSFD
jgi:hypothetical protein